MSSTANCRPLSCLRRKGVFFEQMSFDLVVNWIFDLLTSKFNQSVFRCTLDNVCKSSYFHLRALHHIRNHISEDTAKTTACSMSHARLYCNSVLYGCESEQTSTRSELRRANRNKDQTFRPRNSDPCRPTLVAGQVPNTVQGRSHRSI